MDNRKSARSTGDVAAYVIDQEVRRLFKHFLIIMEDVRVDHDEAFGKLAENLPEEYEALVDQAEFFTQSQYDHLRKKVLDAGNDCIRRLSGVKDKLER